MSASVKEPFDSLLLFTYGGPETPDEVVPFVRSILGPRVSAERIEAAVRKYDFLEGISPINEQSRALLVRLLNRMREAAPNIPVFWATLHSQPTLEETVAAIAAESAKHTAIFVPAPLESALMHRKYLQALNDALDKNSALTLPEFTFLAPFGDNPLYLSALKSTVQKGFNTLRKETDGLIHVVFSAHALPIDQPDSAEYNSQFARIVEKTANALKLESYSLAYQSAPGNSSVEWLKPEVGDVIWNMRNELPKPAALLVPLGFSLDNMEVAYDLDYQMGVLCENIDLKMYRAPTVASEIDFVETIVQQVLNNDGSRLK